MKKTFGILLASAVALAAAAGCGGSGNGKVENPSGKTDGKGNQVTKAAADKFEKGLKAMVSYDEKGNWNNAACEEVAGAFLAAAQEQSDAGQFFAEAKYNAGVAFQRCAMKDKAKPLFEEVLGKREGHHPSRVQLALYGYEESGDIDKALAELNRCVEDSKYKNVEAFVNIASLQMTRQNNSSDKDGANDFERAKKNLQRALAVNDAHMPAFNQLAIYYLETARQKAGVSSIHKYTRGAGEAGKADPQALDLAALVTSQAIQKNAAYAPIHNTAGLIQVEMENLSSAVQSFDRARQINPKFFEAHMNYAAVNLKFRGFERAAQAYQEALKVRPNDYDAHLGLALALRGQINDSNWDQMVASSEAEIQKAKAIDSNRPEAWFNEAVLTQEFKTKSGGEGANKALAKAQELYRTFVQKAGNDKRYAEAVEDITAKPTKSDKQCSVPGSSKDPGCKIGRLLQIDQIIEFNKQTAEMQKMMEQEMKQRAAEEEAAALEGE